MTQITVYFERSMHKMTTEQIKESGWNVLVNKTNGYSLDWQESVPFDEKYIRNIGGSPTIYCTSKPLGLIQGTSSVSFS